MTTSASHGKKRDRHLVRSGVIAGFLLLAAIQAVAEEILVVHHFLSPKSTAHTKLIEPWARQVEQDSDGELVVEIFPSMTLGGKPPELYRQMRDGTVDIIWTVLGYTPGVFPRTEVFELPSVHPGNARAANLAIAEVYDEFLSEDFSDVKPLLIHSHAGNVLHLVDKQVSGIDDLRGMKVRTPSRTGGWLIDAWGAEPVGMPVPELTQALANGGVEGALLPFEVVLPTKVHELTQYSVTVDNRFGTSVFLFAMNKDRYQSLAPKLQAIIDAATMEHLVVSSGEDWDTSEQPGIDAQIASGGEYTTINPVSQADFDAKAAEVESRWEKEANAAGIPAEQLLSAAKDAVDKHRKR